MGRGGRAAHLVPYSVAPSNHFRNCLLVPAAPGLADGIEDGGIGLERVECLDSILGPLILLLIQHQRKMWTYTVVALHSQRYV